MYQSRCPGAVVVRACLFNYRAHDITEPMRAQATPSSSVTDAPSGPIERLLPRRLKPFAALARLDRPIGTWLLLWPGLWSIALAADGWPDARLCALFAMGALVMRSAGCTFNDIVDRNFDARVARTRTRPIPSGAVSVRGAVIFLALLLAAGLAILLQLNTIAIIIGAASLALVFTYPFMKRITYWPQAFLGLTFNWGALVGWAAVDGTLGWAAIILYAGGLFWTLGYDTIYAHQDKEDDVLIGVKSSALALGGNSKPWLLVFYGLTLAGIAIAGALAHIAWPFWIALGVSGLHFIWQVSTLKLDAPANCLARFKANSWVGAIIFAGIVASRALA